VRNAVGAELMASFDAEEVAVQLIGDSIYTNPLILGFAWQKGRVPLSHAALMRAIELNAVQVDNNKAAFEWGRRCAHDLASVQALFKAAQVIEFVKKPSQTEMLTKRVAFLTAYQNAAYAQTYQAVVEKVRAVEAPLGKTTLTEAVTRYLFKLMAYKDEYEVARLHTDSGFLNKVNAMFEGDFKLNYHLAPPLIASKNDQGELQKQQFGPWMLTGFKLLAKLKGLRGTPFDVFGRTEERKEERALIAEYRASIEEVLAGLTLDSHAAAVEIARIPEQIKGYGHVKARHLAAARPRWTALMQAFRQPAAVQNKQAA
jgi:indolepyruvate ferredoxin oxidoreductase